MAMSTKQNLIIVRKAQIVFVFFSINLSRFFKLGDLPAKFSKCQMTMFKLFNAQKCFI